MSKTHVHHFDSNHGFVPAWPGSMDLALMCKCGAWGMPAGGEWQSVPYELLPLECRFRTCLLQAKRVIVNCVIVLAVSFLLAWWFT